MEEPWMVAAVLVVVVCLLAGLGGSRLFLLSRPALSAARGGVPARHNRLRTS